MKKITEDEIAYKMMLLPGSQKVFWIFTGRGHITQPEQKYVEKIRWELT
ncbi:MAG: hypothetical protein MR308_06740 [Lachnospiraceae bacterium]|nr:hypothetical protein [Lachnospiraceae bacterium]